ncbi:hypothetical protein [Nocardia nepalensis]
MNAIELAEVDAATAFELDALEELFAAPTLEPDRSAFIYSYRY